MTKAGDVYECTVPSSAQRFMGLVGSAEASQRAGNKGTPILYRLGFL